MTTGSILAIYAAILATINSVVQVTDHHRERVDVILSVRKNMTSVHDPRYANMKMTLITATNRGKRPVTIQGFAARVLDSGTQYLFTDIRPQVPYEITEGRSITVFADQGARDLQQVECYYAWDAVGREFRIYMVPLYGRILSRFRRKLRRA